MDRAVRIIMLYSTSGIAWYAFMWLFFVISGAQRILGDPARQSAKFIRVFTEYKPLPRMATDSSVLWIGFFICGLFAATAFLVISRWMKGGWLGAGLTYGLLHWLLMTPWFEFYLPYNVMHEPMLLVLFEGGLWLCTLLATGVYMSAVMNMGKQKRNHTFINN